MRRLFDAVPLAPLAVALVALGACGDDGGSAGDDAGLTAAERGEQLVESNGCQSCHNGGVAPSFDGLHGSTVELADGSTVLADEEYLARAISDPGADKVAGYSLAMPENSLSDAQVADIVAYLRTLGLAPQATET